MYFQILFFQGEKFVRVQTTTGHEFRCKRIIVAIPPHQAGKRIAEFIGLHFVNIFELGSVM